MSRPHPIGVVIPTLNESLALKATVGGILQGAELPCEPPRISIAEAPTGDVIQLQALFSELDVVVVQSKRASRGVQFNDGIKTLLSSGEQPSIILLLHADTLLPQGWDRAILDAVTHGERQPLPHLGCFRLDLALPSSSRTMALQVMLWTANMRARHLHLPYGDQAYFLRTALLADVGFMTPLPIMEDVDLLYKLKRHGKTQRRRLSRRRPKQPTCTSRLFATLGERYADLCKPSMQVHVLDAAVKTSPRRWLQNGVWWNTALNQAYMIAWHCGVSPETIYNWYYGRRRKQKA